MPGRRCLVVLRAVLRADAVDLVFEVGLGVEPGPGDAGVVGDGFEADLGAGAVEFVQGGDSFCPGEFVALLGCGDDVNAVVSSHVRRPSDRWECRGR